MQLEKILLTAKANWTFGRQLGQRTLASIITVAAMAFAVPTYAQTVKASKTNSVSSFCGQTTIDQEETEMTQATRVQTTTTAVDESIRPFKFHASDEALADLKRRIAATKWPEKENVSDASQGVQFATMKKLADYWTKNYDWRKVEARLDALPQFITNIDGCDIHFIHVRSKNPNAMPLIVTHGWPGSIIEQLKIIDPLTNPTAHGGKAEDSFDVVIPSLPGYGFSGKPTTQTGTFPISHARGLR